MYPVLKIMHMLNFLDTFSMGITPTLSHTCAKQQILNINGIRLYYHLQHMNYYDDSNKSIEAYHPYFLDFLKF